MARCDITERIEAPPSRIWTWLAPEKMDQWLGQDVTLLTPAPLAKGSRLRVGAAEVTVTEYAENRKLTWEAEDGSRTAFTIGPKDGYAVVLLREEFVPVGLVGRLTQSLRARQVTSRGVAALRRLKEKAQG